MSTRQHHPRWLAAQVVRPRPVLVIVAALIAVYLGVLYPWLMSWGATPTEQHMPLPGDELPADPSYQFTRAITIDAPAPTVWSWIIQIGQDRAGFYSNTWLENIGGYDIHNADVIRPEWQQRAIGDRVPLGRAEFSKIAGASMYLPINALEPGRMIGQLPGRFVLEAVDDHTTRLLLREARPTDSVARALAAVSWEPMHFVMEQRMLRGIKERAEGQPLVPVQIMIVARIGWVLAGAGVLGAFLSPAAQLARAAPAAGNRDSGNRLGR